MTTLTFKVVRHLIGNRLMTVAVGYVRVGRNAIEKDSNRRIQEAIARVFTKFAEMNSVRQVLLWFRQERVSLPAVVCGPEGRTTAGFPRPR